MVSLLNEKKFHKITITDIINTAEVNRSTYYYHYYELDEVLEEVINDSVINLVKKMEDSIRGPIEYKIRDNILPSTIIMFEYIYKYKNYYRSLMQSDISNLFANEFVNAIIEFDNKLDVKFLDTSGRPIDWVMYSKYHAYATFGQVKHWVDENFRQSPEYMAEQLTHFVFMRVESIKVD